MRENKAALRLAVAIHEQLVCRDQSNLACELADASWQQCQSLVRQMHRAQQRGWNLAAARCQRDLRAMIDMLHSEIGGIAQRLESSDRDSKPTASIQDIYHDLLALHDEFNEVS